MDNEPEHEAPLAEQWPPPPLLKPFQAPGWMPSTARPQFAPMDPLRVTWQRSRIARVGFVVIGLGALTSTILLIAGTVR